MLNLHAHVKDPRCVLCSGARSQRSARSRRKSAASAVWKPNFCLTLSGSDASLHRRGASLPPPHLHPLTSSACLLLFSPYPPLFLVFFKQGAPSPSPLSLLSVSLLASPGSTLNHPPSSSSSSCHLNLHSIERTSLLLCWGGTRLPPRRVRVHSSVSIPKPITKKTPPLPKISYLCVCMCVCAMRATQWATWVCASLMAFRAGSVLLLHRRLQNQLPSWVTSPYYICSDEKQTERGHQPPPASNC